jgi:hypothetical protein
MCTGDKQMTIGEFKVCRGSRMVKEIEVFLSEKYGCRVEFGRTDFLNFCVYVKANGPYKKVLGAMSQACEEGDDE